MMHGGGGRDPRGLTLGLALIGTRRSMPKIKNVRVRPRPFAKYIKPPSFTITRLDSAYSMVYIYILLYIETIIQFQAL